MQVRRSLAAVLSVGSLLLATACASDDVSNPKSEDSSTASGSGDKGTVHIAGQNFAEATLVAAMYDELLTDAGYETDVKLVDSRTSTCSTFPKTIDVVPEYVGGIVDVLNTPRTAPMRSRSDRRRPGLVAAGKSPPRRAGDHPARPSAATDTNAFFVTKDYSDSEGVTKLSDLKGKTVVLAANPDCEGRLDCEGGLSDDYGIDITKVLPLGYASDQTYQSVIDGESQLGETSTTDGTLEHQGLVLLDDDKQIQPAQNLVPAVGTDFLDEHPDVAEPLNDLMAALTTEKLTELNGKIAVDREKPEDVAHDFLTEAGLV